MYSVGQCICVYVWCSCFFNDTQETYNDTFFEALDGVTNALDNVDASKSIVYAIGYYCALL